MPPPSSSERKPLGLVVTPSSGSALLGTARSTWNGAKCTRTPPRASKAAPVHWFVASVTMYEKRSALPQRGLHVEGRHRLIERAAYDTPLPVQDGDGLR